MRASVSASVMEEGVAARGHCEISARVSAVRCVRPSLCAAAEREQGERRGAHQVRFPAKWAIEVNVTMGSSRREF